MLPEVSAVAPALPPALPPLACAKAAVLPAARNAAVKNRKGLTCLDR
jgi:hypothetical protein